jgi:uncharacterized membrane protein
MKRKIKRINKYSNKMQNRGRESLIEDCKKAMESFMMISKYFIYIIITTLFSIMFCS